MADCNPPKEDQRVRLTRQLLQNALLELLQQKPVQSITVKELCEVAGVNRGTFYQHYMDIYDLLSQMETAMLDHLQAVLTANPVIGSDSSNEAVENYVRAIFDFFEKNREMCEILLGENGDTGFVEKIIEMGRETSVREYKKSYPQVPARQAEVFYIFIANGFMGLLRYGLSGERPLPLERLADSAMRIIAAAVAFLDVRE